MARIRTIKPDFWESESVGRLSMQARLLFIACLNFADDEGLLRWNEAYLSSQAFVYDELSTDQISELMCELVRENIIFPYKAGSNNQRLAWIICFRNHQVINRPQPSKLPPPSYKNTEFHEAIFKRDRGICHICKEPIASHGQPTGVGSLVGSVDHLTPVSKGGTDYPSNLKTAHIHCNKARGNRPVTDSRNDSVTEVEGKGSGSNRRDALTCPQDVTESVWADFLTLRKTKKAPVTETALVKIRNEAVKAGVSLEDALRECCSRGWQGFKADWMDKSPSTGSRRVAL